MLVKCNTCARVVTGADEVSVVLKTLRVEGQAICGVVIPESGGVCPGRLLSSEAAVEMSEEELDEGEEYIPGS